MSADEAVKEESNSRRKRRRASEEESAIEAAETKNSAFTEGKGRATPGRRNRRGGSNVKVAEQSGNALTRPFSGIIEYFQGVRDELDKVVWPTREELIRLTRIVILVTIASSMALGAISFIFTELFILGFENEIVFAVFFVIAGVIAYFGNRWMTNQGDF